MTVQLTQAKVERIWWLCGGCRYLAAAWGFWAKIGWHCQRMVRHRLRSPEVEEFSAFPEMRKLNVEPHEFWSWLLALADPNWGAALWVTGNRR
jgi:hypothetical protein